MKEILDILPKENPVLCLYQSGSYAYGTNIESSDVDYRGVVMPSKEQIFGMDRFDQFVNQDPDVTVFNIKKFVYLASQANPNILELLFIDREESIILERPLFKWIKANRDLFLSEKVFDTYRGYAFEQSKRLTMFDKSATQNSQRIDLIERFGYDTKKAMHLVRLLRTGIEILRDGELNVYRPDRNKLIDIRNGKYSLDEIKDIEQSLRLELADAKEKTNLPKKVNYKRINDLLIGTLESYLYKETLIAVISNFKKEKK